MTDEDIRDRLAALVAWYESRRRNVDKEIAAAVAAERERAAKVVEAAVRCECERRGFCECYGYSTLHRIAAAIREGK